MELKIRHIKANGMEYPFAFSIRAINKIQEKYGSLDLWQEQLTPEDGSMNFGVFLWTMETMINNGIEIENRRKGESRALVDEIDVDIILTEVGMENILPTLFGVVNDSTDTERDNDPNLTTTQKQE